MGKDPKQQSEFEQNDEQDRYEDEAEVDGEPEETAGVEEEGPGFEQPFCPRCGWHNTRPSYSSNILDMVVRLFGFRPYRCRSCGNRFRSLRRFRKA
jgi:hypothetical protein